MGRPAGVSGHRDGRRTSPTNALWDERGITLIELMVVVSIIAIVAAIAMAIFQQMTQKAKLSADLDTVASLRSAVALYYGRTNGSFPADMASVNTLIAPAPTFQCTATPIYDPGNGKITYTGTISDCP